MAEITASEAIKQLRAEIAGFCTENLSDYMQVVSAELLGNCARIIERQSQAIARMRKSLIGDKAAYEYDYL